MTTTTTTATFQSLLARLVIDLDFRASVRDVSKPEVLPECLTELERERLLAVANDRGLDATRTIYKGFRLSKLLITLPLTNTLLGPARMSREVSAFWSKRPPVGFYYIEEGLAFCDHLLHRSQEGIRIAYLGEVNSYERASLILERARLTGRRAAEQSVGFRHDPVELLGCLSEGRRPRGVPALRCTLAGRLNRRGVVRWECSSW